jgi:hypothetical protein
MLQAHVSERETVRQVELQQLRTQLQALPGQGVDEQLKRVEKLDRLDVELRAELQEIRRHLEALKEAGAKEQRRGSERLDEFEGRLRAGLQELRTQLGAGLQDLRTQVASLREQSAKDEERARVTPWVTQDWAAKGIRPVSTCRRCKQSDRLLDHEGRTWCGRCGNWADGGS